MCIRKVFLFLSMALVVSFLAVRIFCMDQLASRILQKLGAEEVSVHVAAFNFRQFSLDDLAASYRLPGGEQIFVELGGVSLHYSLWHLFTTGRCHRLSIDAITINRIPAAAKETAPSLRLPGKSIFPDDAQRLRLALEEVSVKKILFRGDFPEYFIDNPLQITLFKQETALQATLEMQAGAGQFLHVDLQSPDARHGTANILIRQGDVEYLQASFSLEPESSPGTIVGEKKFSVTAELIDPVFSSVSASLVKLQLAGRIRGNSVLFESGSYLHARNAGFGTLGMEQLSLGLAGELSQLENRIVFELSDQQQLQIKGLVTEKTPLCDITMELNSSSVELKKIASKVELMAEISMPAVVFSMKEQHLALKDLSGVIRLKENQISGQLQLAPEHVPGRIALDFQHDLLHGAGSFTMETREVFNLEAEGVRLSSLISSWPFPFDLDGGKLSCLADGSWKLPNSVDLSASVAMSGGSGFFKEYLFDGLELKQEFALLPQIRSRTAGSVALEHLRGGVDIYDTQVEFNVLPSPLGRLPQLQIDTFRASMFEGSIASSNILYDLNQPDSNFTVDIKGLNLGEVVDLIQMDTLFVSGFVSGSIPVSIRGRAVSVEKGELYSDEPGGEIRYTPGAMNQSGITGYALKAVEELHYKTLGTTLRYFPDGQLDLDIALQGNSPALDSRRPVHLNIHAEQNLPALLQSLRASKGVVDELDKRLQ